MRIEYIILKNYRQYVDEKIIFAAIENKKNFTIIEGANGAGKTNILNAITWCLYGKEINLKKEERGLPLINTDIIEKMPIDASSNVEVEIQMRDESDKKIIFKRSLFFKKQSDGKIEKMIDYTANEADGSKFEINKQIGKDVRNVPDPTYLLQRLIPENIKEYFFFDGERLNEYFKDNSGEKIKDAVFKISQLELLKKVIKHLDDKKKDFLDNSKGLSSKLDFYRGRLEIYNTSKKTETEELIRLKSEKSEAEKYEKELTDKLMTSSNSNITELAEKRVSLENEMHKLEEHINELEKERNIFLIRSAPSIVLLPATLKSKSLIDVREEAGDIPPNFKKNFIEKLLNKGECICGMDIKTENEHKQKVIELWKSCSEITNISEELIKESANLNSIINKLRNFRNEQIKFGKSINELKGNLEIKSQELQKITDAIGNCDVEEIKRLESKLNMYKEKVKESIDQIARKEMQLEMCDKYINEFEKNVDKELANEKRFAELYQIRKFCDESLNAVEKIKEKIMDETRKEIEEKTKKQFFELIWKKETFKDVLIDENYNISVIHKSELEGIGTLSAGEIQVLALSFMAALNSVSGFKVPIVIDTPLGRISSEPKEKIAKNLPNYLEDKQVILLVTEEEYTAEVRQRLAQRVSKEYFIEVEESISGSNVKVIPYERKRSR